MNNYIHFLPQTLELFKEKEYLEDLFINIFKIKERDQIIPCKIKEVKTNGFIVKVQGLHAYLSFAYMPWSFLERHNWHTVADSLLDKIIFCKIFEINQEPLSVIVDATVHLAGAIELIPNTQYTGIVLNKSEYGIFIDIGVHFDWKYKSQLGLLHDFSCKNIIKETVNIGDKIDVFFLGYTEKRQLIFGDESVNSDWFDGKIEEYIGKKVSVKVTKFENKGKKYTVESEFDGILRASKLIYEKELSIVKKAIKNLEDNDIITCEIIGLDKIRRQLVLKWNTDGEIKEILLRYNDLEGKDGVLIQERLTSTLANDLLIGKDVQVEVVKDESINDPEVVQYIVDNKYKGKVLIANKNEKISIKDKRKIEKNLQDGEILECKIMGVGKKWIRVKWEITNKELVCFLE